jgi:hypothetical protein
MTDQPLQASPWSQFEITNVLWENSQGHLGYPSLLSEIVEIFHIAHRDDAKRILDAGKVVPGLIYDKSKLNVHRIQVVWTSPNVWNEGSLYGTVSFATPVSVLDGRTLYWVEEMPDYTPVALRILASAETDLEDRYPVVRFDPTQFGGPLHRTENGQWIRLTNFNYEIMLDSPLNLEHWSRIHFFSHHHSLCNKFGTLECPYHGEKACIGAAAILGYVLAINRTDYRDLLLAGAISIKNLRDGTRQIWKHLRRIHASATNGDVRQIGCRSCADTSDLLRAGLLFLCRRVDEESATQVAGRLLSSIGNEAELKAAFNAVVDNFLLPELVIP